MGEVEHAGSESPMTRDIVRVQRTRFFGATCAALLSVAIATSCSGPTQVDRAMTACRKTSADCVVEPKVGGPRDVSGVTTKLAAHRATKPRPKPTTATTTTTTATTTTTIASARHYAPAPPAPPPPTPPPAPPIIVVVTVPTTPPTPPLVLDPCLGGYSCAPAGSPGRVRDGGP